MLAWAPGVGLDIDVLGARERARGHAPGPAARRRRRTRSRRSSACPAAPRRTCSSASCPAPRGRPRRRSSRSAMSSTLSCWRWRSPTIAAHSSGSTSAIGAQASPRRGGGGHRRSLVCFGVPRIDPGGRPGPWSHNDESDGVTLARTTAGQGASACSSPPRRGRPRGHRTRSPRRAGPAAGRSRSRRRSRRRHLGSEPAVEDDGEIGLSPSCA